MRVCLRAHLNIERLQFNYMSIPPIEDIRAHAWAHKKAVALELIDVENAASAEMTRIFHVPGLEFR